MKFLTLFFIGLLCKFDVCGSNLNILELAKSRNIKELNQNKDLFGKILKEKSGDEKNQLLFALFNTITTPLLFKSFGQDNPNFSVTGFTQKSEKKTVKGDFLPHFGDNTKEFDTNANLTFWQKTWGKISITSPVLSKTIYSDPNHLIDTMLNNILGEKVYKMSTFLSRPIRASIIKGSEIALNDLNILSEKIGYIIDLPTVPITGFLIQVYGGDTKEEAKEVANVFPIYRKSSFLKNLLSQGIAIIDLICADLTENTVFQREMTPKMFYKIQKQIAKFRDILVEHPELISNLLVQALNGKTVGIGEGYIPLYLYGASYGGMRVVRYAEDYHKKHPFNGYISHDGALSYEVKDGYKQADHLNVLKNISKLNAPILVIQNPNDNNVISTVATRFYQALPVDKQKFVTLYMPRVGNLKVSDMDDQKTGGEMHNVGHFRSDSKDDIRRYSEEVITFMAHTANPDSLLHTTFSPILHKTTQKWRTDRYNEYAEFANQFNKKSYDINGNKLDFKKFEDAFIPFIRIEYEWILKQNKGALNSIPVESLTQIEKEAKINKLNDFREYDFEQNWRDTYLPLIMTIGFMTESGNDDQILDWQNFKKNYGIDGGFGNFMSCMTKINTVLRSIGQNIEYKNQFTKFLTKNINSNNLKIDSKDFKAGINLIVNDLIDKRGYKTFNLSIFTVLSRWITSKDDLMISLEKIEEIKTYKTIVKNQIQNWQSNAESVIQKTAATIIKQQKIVKQFKNSNPEK